VAVVREEVDAGCSAGVTRTGRERERKAHYRASIHTVGADGKKNVGRAHPAPAQAHHGPPRPASLPKG
jgi:hypothetical protein